MRILAVLFLSVVIGNAALPIILPKASTSVTSGPPVYIGGDLISRWAMEEASGTRVDSEPTGTAQDLTDNNTVTQAAGKIGNAAQFTAANLEWLSRTDSADLSTGDIDFTVAAWVYLDSKPTDVGLVSKYTPTGNQREWIMYYEGGATDRFAFVVSNNGIASQFAYANTFGAPSLGTWYLIFVWHNASANTINIQVSTESADGAVDSVSHTLGVLDSTSAFQVGRYGGASYHNGRVDEVHFWKAVLTAEQRTAFRTGNYTYTP